MNWINGYFCHQSAMEIAAIPNHRISNEEKIKLELYNKEANALESSVKMSVPTNFIDNLETDLLENHRFSVDNQSEGFVSDDIIKAEFEANYIKAYHFRNGMSDLVFPTDSDMLTLCGLLYISICYFDEVKKDKKKKEKTSKGSKRKKDYVNIPQSLIFNISGYE